MPRFDADQFKQNSERIAGAAFKGSGRWLSATASPLGIARGRLSHHPTTESCRTLRGRANCTPSSTSVRSSTNAP